MDVKLKKELNYLTKRTVKKKKKINPERKNKI